MAHREDTIFDWMFLPYKLADAYWSRSTYYPRRPTPGSTSFNKINDPAEARREDLEYLDKLHPGGWKMRDPDAPNTSTWISPDSVTLKR